MEMWKIITLAITALLVGAVLVEVWMKRGKSLGALDHMRNSAPDGTEEQTPLGMEAIDMDIVREAERMNTNLERKNTIRGRN